MGDNVGSSNHIRIVGAIAGIGSGRSGTWTLLGPPLEGSPCHHITTRFDTIKTRLQCSTPGTYTGAFDTLTKLMRNEGIFALYKGATPPAVGWAVIDSVLLGSLHNYRLFLLRQGMTEGTPSTGIPRLTLFAHGVAGLFAGLTSAIVATPVELVKVKLQLQHQRSVSDRQFRSPIDCIRQILAVQGVRGMWSGFTGSLMFRTNFFWMFLSFEALMRGFSRLQGTPYEISTGSANFLSGGLGSVAFWVIAIPADNVKNRMMSYPYPLPYPARSSSTSTMVTQPSFLSVARYIHSRDGPTGFFRGLGLCLLRAVPVNSCAFFVYEGILRGLGAEKTRQ